jgi:hypothetical protein
MASTKIYALLGFNTFSTFNAGNPSFSGIYAPKSAMFRRLRTSPFEAYL